MKLKQARKLVREIGGSGIYTPDQVAEALTRLECARSTRRPGRWADMLVAAGHPGMAFDLLLRTPEADW